MTEANKAEYLQRFAEQRLVGAIRPQLEAFRNGAAPCCEGAAGARSSAPRPRVSSFGFVTRKTRCTSGFVARVGRRAERGAARGQGCV